MLKKAYTAPPSTLGPRAVKVICSTPNTDRTGEQIVQEGIDLSEYKQNPICLWQHDPSNVIGTCSSIGLEDGNLVATVEFAPEGMSHKADEICNFVKSGIVKTVSVGFDIQKSEPMDPSRPRGPKKYLETTLLELSFVAIPANSEAIVTERAHSTTGSHDERPAAVAPKVRKDRLGEIQVRGLYDVSSLAYLLMQLGWVQEGARCESAFEGDHSALPGMLLNIVRQTGAALIAMTEEEVGELVEALAAETEVIDEGEMVAEDAAIVAAGKTPGHRKALLGIMRAKYAVIARKEGRRLSADTVKCIKDCIAMHEKAMDTSLDSISGHKQAIKAMKALVEDDDNRDTQTSEGDAENEGDTDKSNLVDMTKAQRLARVEKLSRIAG